MGLQINKDTKIFGSFSETPGNNGCLFFNAAFEKHNINAIYKSFYSDNIKDTITSVKHLGFSGFALSMPHKINVIPHLNHLDEISHKIGAVNTVINREGLATNEGNICPDGYASKGVGYCGKVSCEQCISFGCLSGNDKILGGKNWKCERGMFVYLLRWGDSLVRASYDPNCPSGPFKPGYNSTCEQRDFEAGQAAQR